jgi:hypothetical protein
MGATAQAQLCGLGTMKKGITAIGILTAIGMSMSSCWELNPCLRCECQSDNFFQPCPDPYDDYDPTWSNVNFCEEDGWDPDDFDEIESYMIGYGWLCTND